MRTLILLALSIAALQTSAQTLKTVYVLGQSNAAQPARWDQGIGAYANPNTNVFFYHWTFGAWSNSVFRTLGTGHGLPQPLSWLLTPNDSSEKWGIVQVGYGGTSLITDWCSSCTTNAAATNILTQSVTTFPTGYTAVEPRAIVWMQGETDAITIGGGGGATYRDALTNLVTRYRAILGSTNIPFIVVRTGVFPTTERPYWRNIRNAQTNAVDYINDMYWTGVVDGAARKADWIHYEKDTYLTIGLAVKRRMIAAGTYP